MVHRCVGITSTSTLSSHNKLCLGPCDKSQLFDLFGIAGGNKKLSPETVREYVGLWMAKNARPFQMIGDRYVSRILLSQNAVLTCLMVIKAISSQCLQESTSSYYNPQGHQAHVPCHSARHYRQTGCRCLTYIM